MSTATPERAYFSGYGDQVASFVSEYVRQTKGRWAGLPLELEPWQRSLLDELYLVDQDENFVYREALMGMARKNGKSTLMSAITLFGLVAQGEQGAEVYAAAAAKDQARIVFDQARDFVEGSPELKRWLKPMRNAIVCPSNNGIFRVLSSDAPLQHGLNPSLVVIDELHAHKDPELYYALTTGQLARENPMVVSITTAGFDRDSICWQVYQHGRALEAKGVEAMREARFLCRWFQADPAKKLTDEREWKKANPASWIDLADLRRERDRLPEAVFRRLHLNQWTEQEDSWVRPDEWDACKGSPKIDFGLPTFIAIDVGLQRDATAIVWAQWHGDDLHLRQEIRTPTEGKPLSAAENRARLAELASPFEALREVPYDPWSFRESAEMLAEQGLPMVEYPQNNEHVAPASERIYELIRERRLVHDGDETMRSHVLAAVVAQTERGWRISKRKSKERIDGAMALAMAADRAILTRNEKPKRKGASFF